MSLTQTINYDNAADFSFDSTKIEVTGGFAQLVEISYTDEVYYHNGKELNAKRNIGAGSSLIPVSNTSVTSNGAILNLTGNGNGSGAGKRIAYNLGASGILEVGTIRFKYTPNYTGQPNQTQNIVTLTTSLGNTNSSVTLEQRNTSGGQMRAIFTSPSGSSSNEAFATFTFTSGSEYDIELNFDSTGSVRLFINGTQVGGTQTSSVVMNTFDHLVIGSTGANTALSADFSVRDIQIFSTIQNTSSFPGDIPRAEQVSFSIDNPSIVTNGQTLMDDLLSFSDVVVSIDPLNDTRYILVVDGADRYFFGGALILSDGSYAQANTAADIQANVGNEDFTGGVNFKVKALLHHDTGYGNNLQLDQVTFGYSLTLAQLPINTCFVFGYVADNGQPIQNAEITFTSEPFIDSGGNTISINQTVFTDSGGQFGTNVASTTPSNAKVKVSIEYFDSNKKRQARNYMVSVPQQATCNLASIIV